MLAILTDYSFVTVAFGTSIFALASCLLGSISVLKRQSLIGDVIGHASYPGVILAFMVFESRHPLLLTLGAMLAGLLSYRLVYLISFFFWIRNGSEKFSSGQSSLSKRFSGRASDLSFWSGCFHSKIRSLFDLGSIAISIGNFLGFLPAIDCLSF